MSKTDKKLQALDNLNEKIEIMRKKLKRNEWSAAQVDKKRRLNKIIEAGKIFEEAGILDSYNRDEILKLLKSLNGGKKDEN